MGEVYRFRKGHRAPVPAQVIGERLEWIRARCGGVARWRDIVADAMPEGAPLHPCFTWGAEAQERFWRYEARRLARSIEVVPAGESESTSPIVSVPELISRSMYRLINRIAGR
jgi:hypothetical protein